MVAHWVVDWLQAHDLFGGPVIVGADLNLNSEQMEKAVVDS